MNRREVSGLGYVALAVAFFGTSPILVRWAAPLSPYEITFGRMAVAAVAVLLLDRLWGGRPASVPSSELPGEIDPGGHVLTSGSPNEAVTSRRHGSRMSTSVGRFVLYGLIAALHFLLYVASLSYTTIAHSLALVYTAPVFVTLFAALLLGEKLRSRQWLGFPIVVVGVAVLAGFEPTMDARMLFGDLLALGSAVCFGLYSVAGRRERAVSTLARRSGCYRRPSSAAPGVSSRPASPLSSRSESSRWQSVTLSTTRASGESTLRT
jgi:drug/metabolite transporter (DMT)-like permease